ncbi:MAG: hypothetical protein CXZ00_15235 [Acidobacteria bacterium]|nr:MAG: hypothetical protein CXZ00_15235 [Acidobacteriota bacterium]
MDLSPEARVRQDHPLRAIRQLVDAVLRGLSPEFSRMYSREGRPSIAPEKLLRALVLQLLYSVRSERLLMEEIDYSILFRWFIGLNLDERVWDATTFSKNRDRLLGADVAKQFLAAVVEMAREKGFASDEHFTVDGTLLEAWAGAKSFRVKDESASSDNNDDDPGNPTVDFHGERRSNETHESQTDPDSRLARKGPGKEAKLSYREEFFSFRELRLFRGLFLLRPGMFSSPIRSLPATSFLPLRECNHAKCPPFRPLFASFPISCKNRIRPYPCLLSSTYRIP